MGSLGELRGEPELVPGKLLEVGFARVVLELVVGVPGLQVPCDKGLSLRVDSEPQGAPALGRHVRLSCRNGKLRAGNDGLHILLRARHRRLPFAPHQLAATIEVLRRGRQHNLHLASERLLGLALDRHGLQLLRPYEILAQLLAAIIIYDKHQVLDIIVNIWTYIYPKLLYLKKC